MRAGRGARHGGGGKDKFTFRAKLMMSQGSRLENPDDLEADDPASSPPPDAAARSTNAKESKRPTIFSIFKGTPKRRSNDLRRLYHEDFDDDTDEKLLAQRRQRSSLLPVLALAGSPDEGKEPPQDEEDSDEETRDEKARRIRDTVRVARIRFRDVESKRDRAFKACGTVERPQPGTEPWTLGLQRRLGILELRVSVQVKKIQLEEDPPYYKDIHMIVTSLRFEAFIGLLIILNAICIGWDTFYDTDDRRPFILANSEHVFTAIFLIEFFMRIFAFTTLWLCNVMNLFDAFLIWVTGVLMTWILIPMGIPMQAGRRLGALRILRLTRLCRAIRIMPFFKELWMLVQGVMECTTLLLWAMVIGGMVHFTFAVVVLELLVKNDKFKDDERVQEYFGSTTKAMFSLFQIMTLDGWSGIVRPIRERAPEAMLIFGLFMGLSSIVLFNLLIAIVVQNAYDAGEGDVEAVAQSKLQEQRKVRAELLSTFQDLDEDCSGALSREEFNDCLDDYQFVRKMKMLDLDLEELPDFFDILDDGDGELDQDEFITGMMKMQGPALSSEMLKASSLMKQQNAHFHKLHEAFVMGALDTFTSVECDMDSMHQSMNAIMQLTADIMEKLDEVGVRNLVKVTVKDIPFVNEPEVEDLTRAEKKRKKGRTKDESEYDIEHLVPAEAKMEELVPATWIVREGRTPEAKNPGRTKLSKDPNLKQRLKQQSSSNSIKEKILAGQKPVGVHEEMNTRWSTLDAPLNEFGTLRNVASQEDGSSPPRTKLPPLVNYMESHLVSEVKVPRPLAGPAPPPKGEPPALKPTVSYPEMQAIAASVPAESKAAAAAAAFAAAADVDGKVANSDSSAQFDVSRRGRQGKKTRKLLEHPNAVPETLM